MGKTGETPSNWDQASTSSCLANKINCFPPDDECSPCFAPPLQGHRGSLGIKGGYFAHTGVAMSVAGTHHHGKTRSVLLLCLRLGVHLQGVGWDRERTQQMTMGLSVCCTMSATQQGLFLNEVSHLIGIKYLLS